MGRRIGRDLRSMIAIGAAPIVSRTDSTTHDAYLGDLCYQINVQLDT